MILTPKQIEEIEAKCKPGSRPFGSSVRKRLEHFQSLLETVKDLQKKEQRARELLEAAMYYVRHTPSCPNRRREGFDCDCGLPDLEQKIEDYLK